MLRYDSQTSRQGSENVTYPETSWKKKTKVITNVGHLFGCATVISPSSSETLEWSTRAGRRLQLRLRGKKNRGLFCFFSSLDFLVAVTSLTCQINYIHWMCITLLIILGSKNKKFNSSSVCWSWQDVSLCLQLSSSWLIGWCNYCCLETPRSKIWNFINITESTSPPHLIFHFHLNVSTTDQTKRPLRPLLLFILHNTASVDGNQLKTCCSSVVIYSMSLLCCCLCLLFTPFNWFNLLSTMWPCSVKGAILDKLYLLTYLLK